MKLPIQHVVCGHKTIFDPQESRLLRELDGSVPLLLVRTYYRPKTKTWRYRCIECVTFSQVEPMARLLSKRVRKRKAVHTINEQIKTILSTD